jgi:catechol 2,3-dioxygenase-like lactoylglutathione lyase family enzyme
MASRELPAESVGVWQGIEQVTLATPDLDATVAFYRDVLRLRVVFEAPANPMHGRHAMRSPGGTGQGLHFFEVADAQVFGVPGGVPQTLQFVPGALQHVALRVADEAAALALRDRLHARGVPTTPVLTPGRYAPGARTFLFPDPSGLLIKALWTQAGAPPG